MHSIGETLGLALRELPGFTAVCTRKQQLKMVVWRTLLRLSATLHEGREGPAIDATGFDRHSAGRHYAPPTDYAFRSVTTTALVVCERSVLHIHCSAKQPHDTNAGRQGLSPPLDRVQIVTAVKGYEWDDLREELRAADVRPVLEHREFWSLDMAHNARHDGAIYHQRSVVEP